MHERDFIELRGVRVHNLRNVTVSFPVNRWTTVTGVSGSGKSSLVIDTLFAEARRRYAQSLGAQAAELVRGLEKPDADEIGPLPPAVMLPQSPPTPPYWTSVAALAELVDPLCALLARVGEFCCPSCERLLRPCTSDELVERLTEVSGSHRILIGFPVWPRSEAPIAASPRRSAHAAGDGRRAARGRRLADRSERPASWQEALSRAAEAGFRRWVCVRRPDREAETQRGVRPAWPAVRIDGTEALRGFVESAGDARAVLDSAEWWAVVDRLKSPLKDKRARVAEAVETAYQHGDGRCVVLIHGTAAAGSNGAANRALWSDASVLIDGEPWQVLDAGLALHCPLCQLDYCMPSADELRPLRYRGCTTDPQACSPDKGRLRMAGPCPLCGGTGGREEFRAAVAARGEQAHCVECAGTGLNDVARAVRLPDASRGDGGIGPNIADILTWPAGRCAEWFARWSDLAAEGGTGARTLPALDAVAARLDGLCAVGLSYLPLRRPVASLGISERRRVELVRLLATTLVHALYVLDEPAFGVHPLDRPAIVRAIRSLTRRPVTVVLVEHAAEFIEAADRVIVMGPGAGSAGGRVIAVEDKPRRTASPHADDLPAGAERPRVETSAGAAGGPGGSVSPPAPPVGEPRRKPVREATGDRTAGSTISSAWLRIRRACAKNLRGWEAEIPLRALCVITGVGGAGKTALLRDTIAAALIEDNRKSRKPSGSLAERAVHGAAESGDEVGEARPSCGPAAVEIVAHGGAPFDGVVMVDDSRPAGTVRSCVASYLKCYDDIRHLLADTSDAAELGLSARSFSFNAPAGRCERCHGLGVVTIDMKFLGELHARCPDCHGRRFSDDVLQVHFRGHSVADILQMTVDEAFVFFRGHRRIQRTLQLARDVGLGYLTLGQPLVTLSGGELQRIKLARELVAARRASRLFLIDFPGGGLHEADLRRLAELLHTLTRVGHSVIVADHHPLVCGLADWIVALGPGGGPQGGSLLYCGPRSAWTPGTP